LHLAVLGALVALWVAGCADDGAPAHRAASVTVSAPTVVELTAEDRAVWATPTTGRDRIPVLLYHGVAERADFSNQADAFYAVAPAAFAKQMALLHHAGYSAITLKQFRRFHAGEPVDLPAHPILTTFDDGRADAPRNADRVLARYGWSAVMFVDVGAVTEGAAEYATWEQLAEMQRTGRWSIQLHAGRGHHNIGTARGSATSDGSTPTGTPCTVRRSRTGIAASSATWSGERRSCAGTCLATSRSRSPRRSAHTASSARTTRRSRC
jgi:hypothetical protein